MDVNGRAWLDEQSHQQIRHELERLLLSHRSGPTRDDVDDEAWAHQGWRERRIRHLQEILLDATVGAAPDDDGVVEPGMVVTVRLDEAAEPETFLLAESTVAGPLETDVYSPSSPVGRALLGAHEGDVRTCRLPDGDTISITVLAARPYGHDTARCQASGEPA